MITDEQAESRVETDQVLSRSMQVSSHYMTGGAVAMNKGKKGYDDFDYVDNSDCKSEAGASH